MPTRLLIVADDAQTLKTAREGLSDYSIAVARRAEEAPVRYAAEHADAVIYDLALQPNNGLGAVQRIRSGDPAARFLLIGDDSDGQQLFAALRENIIDFLGRPLSAESLSAAVGHLLKSEGEPVEVLSASPQWVELAVPGSFQVVGRLTHLFGQLHPDIDAGIREAVATGFRELLLNSIEHGCGSDARRRIIVSYLRLSRVLLVRIADPGGGFDRRELPHAALGNPPDDPLRHLQVREEKGMRSGGFGILWAQGIVDELFYNERGNEVVFARYLDSMKTGGEQ